MNSSNTQTTVHAAFNIPQSVTISAVTAAMLVTAVVMLLTPPRSKREWAVGLICTIVASLCGGAAVVKYFSIESWVSSMVGIIAIGGVIFSCGLPGWAIVRWVFNYIQKNTGSTIVEVVKDAKSVVSKSQ